MTSRNCSIKLHVYRIELGIGMRKFEQGFPNKEQPLWLILLRFVVSQGDNMLTVASMPSAFDKKTETVITYWSKTPRSAERYASILTSMPTIRKPNHKPISRCMTLYKPTRISNLGSVGGEMIDVQTSVSHVPFTLCI